MEAYKKHNGLTKNGGGLTRMSPRHLFLLRKYHEEMNRQGVSEVVEYGVVFCGKRVEIATRTIYTKN